MQARSDILVSLPLEEAWKRFLDPGLLPGWVEGLESVLLLEGARDALGARSALVMRVEGRRMEGVETITGMKPFSRVVLRLENEDVAITMEATFAAEEGGTRLSLNARFRPRSLALSLMANSLLRKAQARQDRDLARFKTLVEGISASVGGGGLG